MFLFSTLSPTLCSSKYPTDRSSDESSQCSSDLTLQSSSSSSSSGSSVASIFQQADNLAEYHNTKTCIKKSFIEQRFRVELEQSKLTAMMLNNQLSQANCGAGGQLNSQLAGGSHLNNALAGQINSQAITGQISGQFNGQLPGQLVGQLDSGALAVVPQLASQMQRQTSGQLGNQQPPHYQADMNGDFSSYPVGGHLSCGGGTPSHLANSTVSFNNLVNLASQFKMTNRVSAVESKQVNKLCLNSLNEKRKLTAVQNNLVRQASFTYSNNSSNLYPSPMHGGQAFGSPSHHSATTGHYTACQQNHSLERNNLKNLSAYLSQRNKHLTAAYDDCYSDSECSALNKFDGYLQGQRKNVNANLINKNLLSRPTSVSQQSSPSHINYKEKLCCPNNRAVSNWPAPNFLLANQQSSHQSGHQSGHSQFTNLTSQPTANQLNQSNYSSRAGQAYALSPVLYAPNQSVNAPHLNKQNQQLKLLSTPRADSKQRQSLESIHNAIPSDEILQISRQIDCMKSNLYWKEKEKELNYLTSSQTMPSPSKLKQQSSAQSTMGAISSLTSLNNLVKQNGSSSNPLGDSSQLNSLNSIGSTTLTSSTARNSNVTLNSLTAATLNSATPSNSGASSSALSSFTPVANSNANSNANLNTNSNALIATTSTNALEANYSLRPFGELNCESNNQSKRTSPKLCSSKCSLNDLKKLRKDLQQSNQKVGLLTEQLNTNVSFRMF